MKNFDAKKILSIVFICLIVFFMGTIGVKYVMSNVLYIYPQVQNTAEAQPTETHTPSYDWSKDYPFSGDYGFNFETPEIVETKEEEDDEDWLEMYMNAISPNHPDNAKKVQ